MKHTLKLTILAVVAGFFLPLPLYAQYQPPVSQETEAAIDRIVAGRLAEHTERIVALQERVGRLERTLQEELAQNREQTDADRGRGAAGSQAIHVIASGETLHGIGRRYGLTVNELAQANGIATTDTIFVGDRLVIPGGKPQNGPTGPKPDSNGAEYGSYTVQSGDTLSKIAARHQTSVNELMQANGLSNPDQIRVGQVLILASGSSNAGASQAAATAASGGNEETFHYYEVMAGDTLSTIANTFFTTVVELRRLNSLSAADAIKAGQQLIVPTSAYFEHLRKEGVIG